MTWGFCYSFTLVFGRFRAMVAPRLLVSPNIVDHGDRTPGEAPTDGYTQRDICRKGAGRGIAAAAAQGTTPGDAPAPWSLHVRAVEPGSPGEVGHVPGERCDGASAGSQMPGLHVRHQRHPAPAQDQEVRDMPALPAVHPGRQQERLGEHRLRGTVEIR